MINRRPGMDLATAVLIVLLLSLSARLVTAEEPDPRPAAIGSVYRTPVEAMPPLLGEVYVEAIRQELADHGYSPGPADRASGGRMLAAIEAYQRDAGLPVDGIATRELLDHLKFALPRVFAAHPRPKGATEPNALRKDLAVVAPKIVMVRPPARKPSFDAAPRQPRAASDADRASPDADADADRLERQLGLLRGSQKSLVDRLSKRALFAIQSLERTVAMTGLDSGALLPKAELELSGPAQGGPFIPSEPDVGGDPVRSLQYSINRLNLQVDRLAGLEEVVGRLPLTAPLDQFRISSGFGPRKDPITGTRSRHHGIDFAARRNTPVLSTAPGKITYAARKNRYGRLVEIDHGFGVRTRYAHLQKILVKVGQQVGHREKIGLLGSSGRSTGPHVHYEVLVNGKPFDPVNFLRAGHGMFGFIRGS